MVVGETQNGSADMDEAEGGGRKDQKQLPSINQATIDNIMSGIENTGAVKMNNHRKKLRQRFDIIKKLGQGTYGKVQLGINKETGQEVAIKTIKKSKIETEADLVRIRREVQIMSSVQHPNIIHIYEVFENREKMVLVMEFAAGGELYDYLSDRKVLTEEEARRIFRQVSTAIYYCHKHKICHRDLKLENILLDEHGNAKIADFGLSNVFDEQRLLATFCGSPLYASPEIVKGTPYQGPEVDCWSLGVLLYTLVYGAMPFDGANFKRLVKQISQGDYFEPKSPSRASPLIREMLTCCPIRRANIEQICSHWWVNEEYNESCLELAEELANQTPVRLDVLLSLAPPSITSEQVVVPTPEENKERIQKSHSVGSIVDMVETEAERRILDMVAAGGEAAIMPSPTRTLTPQESPMQQPKRKLESTVSTENATGGAKKKEKAIDEAKASMSKHSIAEVMEVDPEPVKVDLPSPPPPPPAQVEEEAKPQTVEELPNVQESLKKIEELCDELMEKTDKNNKIEVKPPTEPEVDVKVNEVKKEAVKKISSPVKRDMVKHKTSDLSGALTSLAKPAEAVSSGSPAKVATQKVKEERKNSLPEESVVAKPAEKRRSRILETAEKFQNMNNQNNEKYKKFSIPGVSVGSFKKEFERKASLTDGKKITEKQRENSDNASDVKKPIVEANKAIATPEKGKIIAKSNSGGEKSVDSTASSMSKMDDEINQSDSKSSVHSFSLEDARRSMENSIALLQKARNESQSKDVDNLCAKTESFSIQGDGNERERKLQTAREIIGNAIPPSRLIGIRKPPLTYGLHGRSVSGGVIQTPTVPFKSNSLDQRQQSPFSNQVVPETVKVVDLPEPPETTLKTSHAEIILKSATLPRRKPTKMEIQVDIKPKSDQSQATRYSTEAQHQMADLHSAPVRENPTTYTSFTLQNRSTSLEPKENVVNIQKPPTYQRNLSNSYKNTLSRQSTNESNDSDTTPTHSFMQSSSTTIGSTSDKQPIKKSPREFIIPISVEGGGIVTPKVNNLEQSAEPQRIGRPKRISSIFSEKDTEEDAGSTIFPKLHRHTSIGRESDSEEPRFHSMHRLRSSRPTKRSTVFAHDPNESDSGDEDEDDDDGFELLTAENLFSTLLSRVRALTHRLNVNNEPSMNFSSSRLMNNLRTSQSPFWNNDPFGSKCTSYRSETITESIKISRNNMHPWRTNNLSHDLHSDFDSMFSRSGATLPRGKTSNSKSINDKNNNNRNEILDLGDLDLSQLRLSKKDLETLSSITPSLSKNIQDQLLAQLPKNEAKKLSRTLSMQNQNNNNNNNKTQPDQSQQQQQYRRSISNNPRESINRFSRDSVTPTNEIFDNINNNHHNARNNLRQRRSNSRDDSLNNNSDVSEIQKHQYRERTLSPCEQIYLNNNSRTLSPSEDIERACFSPPPLYSEKKTSKKHSKSSSNDDETRKPLEKPRELATHKILREMREKSQERNIDYVNMDSQQSLMTSAINNKILDELNSLSLLNNQLEKYNQQELQCNLKVTKKKSSSKLSEDSQLKIYDEKEPKSEPKLARPKSFITKGQMSEKLKVANIETSEIMPHKLERPKSFPNSKITPPKELKKFPEALENVLNNSTSTNVVKIDETSQKSVDLKEPTAEPKKVKKIVKVVKKSSKKSQPVEQQAIKLDENPPQLENIPKRESSPEKKNGKGLFYALGQKFEKLRDTKTKPKTDEPKEEKKSTSLDAKEKKMKLKAMLNEDVDEQTRQERKSKIDALIKNLKEKSIPHNSELTESGLIKRAVSVEEMPNTFNKNAVNKVLGLFKRIEKENENVSKNGKVQNTKSTSFISSMDGSISSSSASSPIEYLTSNVAKERPKSSSFVNKIKSNGILSFEPLANICESKIPVKYSCPDCKQPTMSCDVVTKRHTSEENSSLEEKERIKNNRKGLMLDFSRFKSPEPEVMENSSKNNYSFPPPLPDVGRNAHTPTYDNLANYSSAAFDTSISSPSPNDEIGFDCNWSTCSDDHTSTMHPSGSLSLSRLSKSNQNYIDDIDSPESVIDRIRRKSFYSRFNEKKTKRVSNIVGPGASKDYYRERSRGPMEYTKSATSIIPDLSTSRASSVESSTPHIRSSITARYSSANRSLSQTRTLSKYSSENDTHLPHSSSFRRTSIENNNLSSLPPPSTAYHVHHHHHDLLRKSSPDDGASSKMKSNRNTMYDSSSSSSNTPSSLSSIYAKRRSFVSTASTNPSTTTSSSMHYASSSLKPPQSFVDSYATIGRKMRQYNTRSVSLLDPTIINSTNNHSNDYHRVNGHTDAQIGLTRSLRSYRNSSVPRNDNI